MSHDESRRGTRVSPNQRRQRERPDQDRRPKADRAETRPAGSLTEAERDRRRAALQKALGEISD